MRFTILFLLCSVGLSAQVEQAPAMLVSSVSVISSSAPNYTLQGSFSSQFGYTRDSIQEGTDVMWMNYTISNPDRPIRALIDSFTIISGNTLRFYVTLLDGETVLAFPTGTASIYRPTPIYGFHLEEPNESNTTKAQKANANMLQIEAAIAAAGGGGTATDTVHVTQASPTFAVGDLINWRTGTTGGSLQLADLDVDSLMCKGIITEVNATTYTIQIAGLVDYPGVKAGVEYYLSNTAGDTTTTVLDSFQYIGIGARDGVLSFSPGLKVVNSQSSGNSVQSVQSLSGTDTITVNFADFGNGIFQVNLDTVTSSVLDFQNPVNGGVYVLHFMGVSNDSIVFPSNVYFQNASQAEAIVLAENEIVPIYYDGTDYWLSSSGNMTLYSLLAGSFTAEYQAVIAKALSLAYALPDDSIQVLQNQLVIDLKASGAWDSLDVFYMFAHDAAIDFGRINWIDPDVFLGTVNGTVTQVTNLGVKSDGSTGYVATGIIPQVNTTFLQRNNAAQGMYVTEYASQSSQMFYGTQTTSPDFASWVQVNPAGTLASKTNSTTGQSTTTSASFTAGKLCTQIRVDASNHKMYYNATSQYTSARTSGSNSGSSNGLTLLARNTNGARDSFCTATLGCFFMGGGVGVETNISAFSTAINDYFNSL